MEAIELVSYDTRWPNLFAAESARIRLALGEVITRIEHFGSTAVPGLDSKPVIDMLVGVRSLYEGRVLGIQSLGELGYAFWYDDPDSERLFFVKGLPPNGPRTHHIHMVEPGSLFWERLLFRDYLRAHADEAARYAALKRELAARFRDDREAYTDSKAEYLREVMEKARMKVDSVRA